MAPSIFMARPLRVSAAALAMALLLSHCETWDAASKLESLPSLFSRSENASPPPAPLVARPIFRGTGKTEKGKMSWYSVKTNRGTRTASGEPFSDSGMTAAHRTLPFGTKVKVTNLNNEKSAVVRITDRGPHIRGRIVDVSIGAARKLDFVGAGVVPCEIEVLR